MPFKDPEKRRESARKSAAKRRAENPAVREADRERDRIRWANMTPEQRRVKEAQRSPENREKRRLDMQRYMADDANRARVNEQRRARRVRRIASGDTSVKELHKAATDRYHKRYRGDVAYQARKILATVKHRSKKKGLAFDLTLDWYLSEFPKGCAATGLSFDSHLEGSPWIPNIDKIVPSKGYVMNNCRLVCACFNMAKREWSDADVIKMAEALLKNQPVSDA